VAIVRDISERVAAEQSQRRTEMRFRSLAELSSDSFWETDEQHRFTSLVHGSGFAPIFTPEAQMGIRRWEVSSLTPDAAGWAKLQATMDAHERFSEFEFSRADGRGAVFYRSISGEPLFDEAGAFTGYQGIARDITARKRGEALQMLEHAIVRKLAEAETESAAVQAAIRVVCEAEQWDCGRYFRVDEAAGILRVADYWGVESDVVAEYLGASRTVTYLPGVGYAGRAWQSGRPMWSSDITTDTLGSQPALSAKYGIRGAFVFPVRADGVTLGVIGFNSREVREPEPRLIEAIASIGAQIGQFLKRKRAEEAQRRFRAALDASADMITLVDPQSMRYIDVNTTACEMQGYTREQMLAMGPQD
ncbi:MAG: PAS domain S-box protein, partial [Hyphomicrobium sp.]|nr:PAS domain S-box protein [Hyphomicrobium sp.]